MLTKTARALMEHLYDYGGSIISDDDGYRLSWGSLLKNGETNWHNRSMTFRTFQQILPFLKVLDEDIYNNVIEYELNTSGYHLIEAERDSARAAQAGRSAV